MTEANSKHYPEFDVMDEKKHWDAHTQKVVENRLKTLSFYPYQFLNQKEADTLQHLCGILVDEQRYPILAFIVHHIDKSLASDVGESQRKAHVPKQTTLYRDGLLLLDEICQKQYGSTFSNCQVEDQQAFASDLMKSTLTLQSAERSVPVVDFAQRVLSDVVSAYYSHPTVWSEIGYAGPAYPRGYVRSELGLTDPWEARKS